MIPFSCAAWRASATWRAIATASASGSGPAFNRSARVSPSTSSRIEALRAVDVFETIDGGDVRMIQRGEEVRFALKPGDPLGIVDEAVRDHLEGHLASELRVARAIHFAHPAGPEGGENLVRAEASAGRKTHRMFGSSTARLYGRMRSFPRTIQRPIVRGMADRSSEIW